MATRFYLRNAASTVAGRPSASEAVGETDLGHVGVDRFVALELGTAKGNSQGSRSWWEASQATHEDLVGIWLSPPIAQFGQVAAGTTFTVGITANTTDHPVGENPEFRLRVFVYLWRRGQGRVATLSDSSADATTAHHHPTYNASPSGPLLLVATTPGLGAAVDIHKGDRIVLEVWAQTVQVDAYDATENWYYNGSSDAGSDGDEGVTDFASYLECSQTLALEGGMEAGNFVMGGRDIEVDSVNIGGLEGAVTYRYQQEIVEAEVEQRMGPVGAWKTKERLTVACTMKEATLENLRIAHNLAAGALSTEGDLSTLMLGHGGTPAGELTGVTVDIKGTAHGGRERTLHLNSAVVIEVGEVQYGREGFTTIPVTFLALEDSSQPDAWKFGYIRDDNGSTFTFA